MFIRSAMKLDNRSFNKVERIIKESKNKKFIQSDL